MQISRVVVTNDYKRLPGLTNQLIKIPFSVIIDNFI